MNYNIVDSGSKGNLIIINGFFALDMGITYKKAKSFLKGIKIVFISHIHSDHLNKTTIKQLAYNFPNIKYICGSTDIVDILVNQCNVKKSNIYALASNKWYDLGAIKVRLEQLTHDVSNHLIKFQIKDKKGIYIVDTDNVDNVVAKNYSLYLIEANYQDEILQQHKAEKDEKGEFDHLYRVENTHLSFSQANDFLIENMGNNSIYEYIHKSEYNFKESD